MSAVSYTHLDVYKRQSEWFAAGFDQLDDIRIQTDCTHGEDDEELAECLQRSKYICGYAG